MNSNGKASIAHTIEKRISKWFSADYSLGLLLIFMVLLAMGWANSPWGDSYFHLWETRFTIGFENAKLNGTLHQWVNDALMAHFFFLVGLEIKKEIIDGELSTLKKASLPILAALGGMVFPALIYLAFNFGGDGAMGWGIPMATDIAFALGLISLVGSRISKSLKTFLTALATVDDLGAILVIAVFLTPEIDMGSLLSAGIYFIILMLGNIIGIRSMWFYLIVGFLGLWIAVLFSGVHATLAGVLAAFAIPSSTKITEGSYKKILATFSEKFETTCNKDSSLLNNSQKEIIEEVIDKSEEAISPLQHLQHRISPFINFVVLPMFAFANAGVLIEGDVLEMILHPVSLGIIMGLFIGKLMGILVISRVTVKMKIGTLPQDTNWNKMIGLGLIGGIGFTMSLFIADLAFDNEFLLQRAKLGVLIGSLISGVSGIFWFRFATKKITNEQVLSIKANHLN